MGHFEKMVQTNWRKQLFETFIDDFAASIKQNKEIIKPGAEADEEMTTVVPLEDDEYEITATLQIKRK